MGRQVTWTNAANDDNWFNMNDWSPVVVPGASSDVVIHADVGPEPPGLLAGASIGTIDSLAISGIYRVTFETTAADRDGQLLNGASW